MEERLQKILARAGVASRRKAEALIESGQVTVDGKKVTELGVKVDSRRQEVRVQGRVIKAQHFYYVLFHKPREVMCTLRDPEGRRTVIDFVKDVPVRVVPVGRLDYHTSGVLLLSNDGQFVQALAHQKQRGDKVYVAKVQGVVDDERLERWRAPLVIDGKQTRPAGVKRLRVEGQKTWLELTLSEGRNRQIHRLGEAVGNVVLRLARTSFAGLTHDGLRPGQWRYLSRDELVALKRVYGVPTRVRPPEKLPPAASTRARRGAAPRKRERSDEGPRANPSPPSKKAQPVSRERARGPSRRRETPR